jgi:16S rRNA (guanine1516-N2)-methyltransferase
MLSQKTIALICECKTRLAYAQELSKQLNIPIRYYPDEEYLLVVTDEHVELRSMKDKLNPLYVDFLSSELDYRLAKSKGSKEMIARAVGIKAGEKPSILDATAGLGKDAFVLASLGCQMHCLERSPLVGALLADGLQRLFADQRSAGLQLTLTSIDAIDYLHGDNMQQKYDVVYLDPMFPEKKKNALPKKGMRIFRDLLGYDQDTQKLFELALKHAFKRVVVKRPRHAVTITDLKPDIVFHGKSSRFDVYLSNKHTA